MSRGRALTFLAGSVLASLVFLASLPGQVQSAKPETPGPYVAIIEEFRASIPKLMQEQSVPGLAVAVVDDREVLWVEGFGFTDTDRKIPVSPKTLFSIQSMSKNLTAAAVLLAVQEGLVDLDTPIKRYLPEFTVNSRFEAAPEEKITLRLLLSHRAGFTQEAPVGSNFEPGMFEDHIQSIPQTWLRFPVNERYSYSNLGVDLAGYVLQIRSGLPFQEYVKRKLLDPLGMKASTFDIERIKADSRKAIGHSGFPFKPPVEVPMVPSGGFYTNAAELARYVQWHLDGGKVDGRPLLRESLYRQMAEIPERLPHQTEGYGLGIGVDHSHGKLLLNHGGGGFGFLAEMEWHPDWKLGIVCLTNSTTHNFQKSLPDRILDRFLVARIGPLPPEPAENVDPSLKPVAIAAGRLRRLAGQYLYNRGGYMVVQFKENWLGAGPLEAPQPFTFFSSAEDAFIDLNGSIVYNRFVRDKEDRPLRLVRLRDGEVMDYNDGPMDAPGPDKSSWERYVGKYRFRVYGLPSGTVTVQKKSGYLYLDNMKLQEYRDGLFFTGHGEALDFRGLVPTWRNIKLEKI